MSDAPAREGATPPAAMPWTAEREVDAALAARLVDAQFPELAPARAERLGHGWDNTVFRVNGAWTFRFPRRAIAVELVENEVRVLPHLAPRLPLPIPAPVHVGRPSDAFPWPFLGARYLEGADACDAALDDAARARLAEPLAECLAALHAVPADAARAWGAGPDTLGRTDVARRLPQAALRLRQVADAGLYEPLAPLEAALAAFPTDWTPGPPALVHGDLYSRQVLVAPDGRPTGVIDWGDVHLGERGYDLSLAYTLFPPGPRAAFLDRYGPAPAGALAQARFRGLHHSLACLLGADHQGDAALAAESRRALDHLAAD